jgi:uncharacterized protein (DUF2062 family)
LTIGIFIGITPTIPFHTVLAIMLAFFLRGSKPAAILGVWVSNPFTIPILYFGSYKAGLFLFGRGPAESPAVKAILGIIDQPLTIMEKFGLLEDFFIHHVTTGCKIIGGGFVLALVAAIPYYVITLKMFTSFSEARKRRKGHR